MMFSGSYQTAKKSRVRTSLKLSRMVSVQLNAMGENPIKISLLDASVDPDFPLADP